MSTIPTAGAILQLANFPFAEIDLVGVELPLGPQPFVQICIALLQAELNVHYTYPLLYHSGQGNGPSPCTWTISISRMRTLRDKGHRIITENDLLEDEPYNTEDPDLM